MKLFRRILALACALTLAVTGALASYSSSISDIYDTYRSQNRSADNVYQQIVNGTYRSFEISYIIANIVDRSGSYKSTISDIYDSYRSQNRSADNVYQQIVNGTYRTFEMLYVIAKLYDSQTVI